MQFFFLSPSFLPSVFLSSIFGQSASSCILNIISSVIIIIIIIQSQSDILLFPRLYTPNPF